MKDLKKELDKAENEDVNEDVKKRISKSPYTQMVTDKEVEKKGIVLDYGDYQIRIARAGGANTRYRKVLKTKLMPYRSAIQSDTLTNKKADSLLIEVYAESVVLELINVFDENGDLMETNRDNIIKILTDIPDLFKDIITQADKMILFRKMEVEEDLKN